LEQQSEPGNNIRWVGYGDQASGTAVQSWDRAHKPAMAVANFWLLASEWVVMQTTTIERNFQNESQKLIPLPLLLTYPDPPIQ
jgi:hypothetical protein